MADRMASPLARVRGLGSARDGAKEWWLYRVGSLALVPLSIWWIAAVIAHTGADYATFIDWLRSPIPAILLIITNVVLFQHIAHGLQSVVEDYVHHDGAKLGAVIAIKFGCVVLAVAGIFSVLRVAFGG